MANGNLLSLMNIAAINGMIVFAGNQNALSDRREYLKTLIHNLTAQHLHQKGEIKSFPRLLQQTLKKYNHVPEKEQTPQELLDNTRKLCKPCYSESKRR